MYRFSFFSIALILSFSACKKEKETTNEELPVFGACEAVAPAGHLSQASPAGPYTFTTNGGGKIVFDPATYATITHDDYPGFSIELWGDVTVNGQAKTSANHENLNGKRIKDRIGTRRTIVFPDGAKITMVAESLYGQLLSVSIYDGAESHHINPACNTLEYSSTSAAISQKLDNIEPDGETAAFEFTPTGLLYVNIYTEEAAGTKITNRKELGEIFRDEPNRVNDYYTD